MDERRLELKVGVPVIAKDGNCGYIHQVILDPHQEKVIGLVVKPDFLAESAVNVPIDQVADATEHEVRIWLDSQQVLSLPKFQEESPFLLEDQRYLVQKDEGIARGVTGTEVFRAPSSNKTGMVESQIVQESQNHPAFSLGAGQKVFSRGQRVGRVHLLLINPTGKIKSFVIQTRSRPSRELIVPIEWIQEVDQKNVTLSEDKQALDRLDEYVPDAILAGKINQVIRGENLLRVTEFSKINVKIQDGIVSLLGHIPTSYDKLQVENAVNSVPGVLGIKNRLVADYDLKIQVAQALGKDDRMRTARVSVNTRNGIVSLSGHVENASIHYLAEGLAASVPYVRGVMNDIHTPGISRNPAEGRFLQPPIGQEVYATDMCLGTVERVIIDPHNRRVTAFVTLGNFPDPKLFESPRWLSEDSLLERRVILPVRSIRYETDETVFLNIGSMVAAGYSDYNEAQYAPVPDDWQPPYPYDNQDILFEGHTKRLLEDLHELAGHGSNSKQMIAAAELGSKEEVEALIQEYRVEAQARQEVIKAIIMERHDIPAGQWDEIQENFQQKAQMIMNKIENETREANNPKERANAAESYAEAAIGFTILAIDAAEVAMLEAIEATGPPHV